jgi:hypothetical protein
MRRLKKQLDEIGVNIIDKRNKIMQNSSHKKGIIIIYIIIGLFFSFIGIFWRLFALKNVVIICLIVFLLFVIVSIFLKKLIFCLLIVITGSYLFGVVLDIIMTEKGKYEIKNVIRIIENYREENKTNELNENDIQMLFQNVSIKGNGQNKHYLFLWNGNHYSLKLYLDNTAYCIWYSGIQYFSDGNWFNVPYGMQ